MSAGGTPPEPRAEHAAVYDPVLDRMILFGGRAESTPVLGDLWSLEWAGDTDVPGPFPGVNALAIERVRFHGGAIGLELALADDTPLRIEPLDAAGRRALDVRAEARAQLRIPFRGGSGVYFVRVRQGAYTAGGRVAVVR